MCELTCPHLSIHDGALERQNGLHSSGVDKAHDQGCQVLGGDELQDARLSVPAGTWWRHLLSRRILVNDHGSCSCVSTKQVSNPVAVRQRSCPWSTARQLQHRLHLGSIGVVISHAVTWAK